MTDLVGQTLGRYQLVERLGRGGMADVYKGYQPGLDRYVAVKVLHPHLAHEENFITRFQREARAVARLRHPHIVQVFDFDVQGEWYFMVMEYIEGGRTLKELLRDLNARGERLPAEQVLAIMASVADALDFAHGQGMIHRDIKPSNVLLPDLAHPVLSDFGIARLMGQTGLTGSGVMIGTPAYMSPEQGRGEPADERSDIYALGIVLYEMLTGQPPYDADTPYGVILKHINDPLVPPHNLIGPLPDAVERVVFKSLAKEPADRYGTAREMHAAIHAARREVAAETAASETTPPGDIEPQLESEPEALAPTLVEDDAEPGEVPVTPQRAGEPVSPAATLAEVQAEGITPVSAQREEVETLVAPPGQTAAAAATQVPAAMPEDIEVDRVPIELSAPPPAARAARRGLGWWVWAVGAAVVFLVVGGIALGALRFGGAATPAPPGESAQPAQATPQEEAPPGQAEEPAPPEAGRAQELVEQGYLLLKNEPDAAFARFDEAAGLDPHNAEALAGRATVHIWRAEPEMALGNLEQAQEIAPDNPRVNYALGLLHTYLENTYDADAALAAYNRAVEGCGDDAGLCAAALRERAILTGFHLGNFDPALADIERALAVQPEDDALGPGRPELLATRGDLLWGSGDVEGAIATYEDIYNSTGDVMKLEEAARLAVLADQLERAAHYFDRLLVDTDRHPYILTARAYLAWRMGDWEAAVELSDEALTVRPGFVPGHYMAGLLALDDGRPEEALALWERVLSEPDTGVYEYPFFNPDFGHEIHLDMARAAWEVGDPDRALELIAQSLAAHEDWNQPYILRAELDTEQGHLEGARENYRLALERTDDPDLRRMLEQRLADLGG